MRHYAALLRQATTYPLATSRRMIAAAALLKAAAVAPTVLALARPGALRFPLAPWMPVPSGSLLAVLLAVWLLAALALLVGWRTRAAGVALTAVLACLLVGDQQLYSNHLYLLTTLVGLVTLAEGPWVARPILLLRLQTTIVYGFAAATKINVPYLSGAVLNSYVGQGSLVPFPESMRTAAVMASLAVVSIIVEALLAIGLWMPRWRKRTIVLGVLFHVGAILLLDTPIDLVVFALLMFALYVLHAADGVD